MTAPLAVFRCDAGVSLGGGHVMRCLALAEALERAGWATAFACVAGSERVVPALEARAPLLLKAADDAGALTRAWPSADLLVVDHYGLDARFEAACAGWAGRVLVLDDLADRPHDCDLLLDQTLGRDAADYRPLVPARCRVLAGSAFAVLRPEFAALRAQALARRTGALGRILVSFGATDPVNATGTVLAGIRDAGLDVEVDVVLGAQAPHLDAIRAGLGPNARLHVGSRDMGRLMLEADLAFGGGGTTAWERCCLGLPTLMVILADNQRLIADTLQRTDAAAVLGDAGQVGADAVAAALRGLTASRLAEMSAAAFGICDGLGADRVIRAVMDADHGPVTVRPAEAGDAERLFTWKNDPVARDTSLSRALVPWADHLAWFQSSLAGGRRRIFVAECAGNPVGAVRFDYGGDGAVVSLVLAPEARGRGLGAEVLGKGIAAHPAIRLDAAIRATNAASLKVFSRNGFAVHTEADGILHATRLPS